MTKTTERAAEIHRGMTPHQMALRIVALEDLLDLAKRSLTAAGFTDLGGPEWKPPLGPSASPLLERIDQLQAELDTVALTWDYIDRMVKALSWLGYSTPESKEEQAAKQNRLVFNLIRAVEESKAFLTAREGWQPVPAEPTPEMIAAGMEKSGMIARYKAMLAAAPKPQGGASC